MSEFSQKFHVHGVKNTDDFLQCLKSLCESHSVNLTQLLPSTPTPISTPTASSTGSRKRKADSETPHRTDPPALRPLKIVRTTDSNNTGVSPAVDTDEDIQKSFVGE